LALVGVPMDGGANPELTVLAMRQDAAFRCGLIRVAEFARIQSGKAEFLRIQLRVL
jgi:hypothetical protein